MTSPAARSIRYEITAVTTIDSPKSSSCHSACACATSTITVAIEPGPASSGIASGTIATSGLAWASWTSLPLVRVREGMLRSMSSAVSISSRPPAILNAASVRPNSLKIRPPPTMKVSRMAAVMTQARRAICCRFCSLSPSVMVINTGTTAMGSTTKKMAENATTA